VEARTLLARAAGESSADLETLVAHAEFLDRYGDPGRRAAYLKAFEALGPQGSADLRRSLARRLATVALLEGDSQAASQYVAAYRQAGGSGLDQADAVINPAPGTLESSYGLTTIPGPLFSFRRMAALSSDQAPEELLPALARNVMTSGYRASRGADSMEQTEYLKLLLQYLSQARELLQFAGEDKAIDVPQCESAETAQLLKILGFRLRNECGPEAVLETVNPSRAFLSIDSGFPLADLEQAYRAGQPFRFPYESAQLPVLWGEEYWIAAARRKPQGGLVDALLADPALARLHVAVTKIHGPTALVLKEKIDAQRLKDYAHVLDFFGGMFEIRDGKAVYAGGPRSEGNSMRCSGRSTKRWAIK
jgi:hypothetical protein